MGPSELRPTSPLTHSLGCCTLRLQGTQRRQCQAREGDPLVATQRKDQDSRGPDLSSGTTDPHLNLGPSIEKEG